MIDNTFQKTLRGNKLNSSDYYSLRILDPFLFASDLDGTLIPTGKENHFDMERTRQLLFKLRETGCPICYVTGRNISMTKQVIRKHDLITPDWWICDLGSEIYDRTRQPILDWNKRMGLGPLRKKIIQILHDVKGLTLQEETRQGPGKCSYYSNCSDSERVKCDVKKRLAGTQPHLRIITSIDETTGTTLVDVISAEAGKARAVNFVALITGFDKKRVHYSGDSGNDLDALLSGICSTLVGNAASHVHSVIRSKNGTTSEANVYLARACYGDGVIEGLLAHTLAYSEDWRHVNCE